MSVKCLNLAVFVILVIESVVCISDIQKYERVLLDNSKNVSAFSYVLQDLLKKCAMLKKITQLNLENPSHKININDFLKPNTDYKVRSKVSKQNLYTVHGPDVLTYQSTKENKINYNTDKEEIKHKGNSDMKTKIPAIPDVRLGQSHEFVKEKTYFTDETGENKGSPIFKSLSTKEKISDSENSEETTTQNRIKYQDQTSSYKNQTTPVGDKLLVYRESPNENEGPQDINKVLIIHIGPKPHQNLSQPIKNEQHESLPKPIVPKSRIRPKLYLEDKNVTNEEFLRANSLRESEACTKLATRKCINALKSVLSDVCKKTRKCSVQFNDEFTENGNAACEKYFGKKGLSNKRANKKSGHDKYFINYGYDDDNESSKTDDQELIGNPFIDFTRQGLHMSCLDVLSDDKKPKKPVKRTNATNIDAKTHPVNILRDKLEDACRKTCFDRCSKACNTTSDKTCKNHECITVKIKALKKSCKWRCQEVYNYKASKSSESESESDSDDSSGNDSEE